ncbi:MAG: serine/threonine-protein kinase, partial [Chloroflexota bacterium]
MSGPICPVCRRGNRSASAFCAFCGYRLKPGNLNGAGKENNGLQANAYAPAHPGSVGSAAPPTIPIPADVSGNLPSGVILKRRYRILRKIAQGGMGAVYESLDTLEGDGRPWAVKEMSPASLPASERTQAVADFRREALILHGLHHPNLPEVRETFEEMGKHFLVMEFIAGRTLLNVLDVTPGFLPEERVMVWARQLFEVIHYLHAQDPPVIYRDVKPANIMLVEGTERLKLIDFGIARFHRQGKMQDTEAFGTAGYA